LMGSLGAAVPPRDRNNESSTPPNRPFTYVHTDSQIPRRRWQRNSAKHLTDFRPFVRVLTIRFLSICSFKTHQASVK
jgi:hypothetical protein